MPEFRRIWIEQCEAARGIEDEFGVSPASTIVARRTPSQRPMTIPMFAELAAFVAEIKTISPFW